MASHVRKILLVYKTPMRPMSQGRRQHRFIRESVARRKEAAPAHRKAIEVVRRVLRSRGVQFQSVARTRTPRSGTWEGIIAVGGDGTFLEAARLARSAWVLGVNSDPARSVGSFCAATAKTFEGKLDRILEGKARFQRLHRLTLAVNGKTHPVPALNDLLVTHARPAAMSRYWLQIGRSAEEQRSSGLWLATAAGSTGAIRSAGGRFIPKGSGALQYRPRELYRGMRTLYRLRGGIVSLQGPIRIGSLMKEGLICVDGEHHVIPFCYGSVLTVCRSPHPLRLAT